MEKSINATSILLSVLYIQISVGRIIDQKSSPLCGGSNIQEDEVEETGTLTYNGSNWDTCKWSLETQMEAEKALILYVKELTTTRCTANLQIPGARGTCVRTEPYCHVYTSRNSYCNDSDINRQVQQRYNECNHSDIHKDEYESMDIDFKKVSNQQQSFTIEYGRITCQHAPSITATSLMTETTSSTNSKSSAEPVGSSPNTTATASEPYTDANDKLEEDNASTGISIWMIIAIIITLGLLVIAALSIIFFILRPKQNSEPASNSALPGYRTTPMA